eukprot:TRINITY_DN14815_c0_g1_i1.p1 TRINITY_DN14815_c0_g1~~TRINITY_DN14815_c0_g1_i1.p1  ORF type:complete len:490 (-),score=61.32 TRINITY_DN14815_c0_g1_i1:15-1484(-)
MYELGDQETANRLWKLFNTSLVEKIPLSFKRDAMDRVSIVDTSAAEQNDNIVLPLCFWMSHPPPLEGSSEMTWNSWWDPLFSSLPLLLKGMIVRIDRNVSDSSFTATHNRPQLKRDYNLKIDGNLLVAGEDKVSMHQLQAASDELAAKTKRGVSEQLYGKLKYIIGFATGGPLIRFFMMTSGENPMTIPLGDSVLNTLDPETRLNVMIIFINILRWAQAASTIVNATKGKIYPINSPRERPNPYPGLNPNVVTIKLDHVEKKITLPQDRVENLQRVYTAIAKCENTVRLAQVLIHTGGNNWKEVDLDKIPGQRVQRTLMLRLVPVLSEAMPETDSQRRELLEDVLTFLSKFHSLGFVHRDIRWPNIMRSPKDWILIDYEAAAPAGEKIFWTPSQPSLFREEVLTKKEGYTFQDDLFQLGKLFDQDPIEDDDLLQVIQSLKDRDCRDAGVALGDLMLQKTRSLLQTSIERINLEKSQQMSSSFKHNLKIE